MGQKILIIEDEFLVAMDLENIVASAGYDVVGVAADRAALALLDPHPEVALVDLNLRDGPTGAQMALELAERKGTKIIYVTANPDQIGTPAPTAIGFVQKPFSSSAIKVALAIAGNRGMPDPIPAGLRLFNA